MIFIHKKGEAMGPPEKDLILTSPAPWKRNKLSDILPPVILRLAKMPATATDAVPVRFREKRSVLV